MGFAGRAPPGVKEPAADAVLRPEGLHAGSRTPRYASWSSWPSVTAAAPRVFSPHRKACSLAKGPALTAPPNQRVVEVPFSAASSRLPYCSMTLESPGFD